MSHTPTPDSMADLQRRIAVLEDREAIRELDARYCRYLDQGQWDELADCFTPDGTFDGLSVVRGRSDLVRFFAGLADGGLTTFWHHISNLEITVHPGADGLKRVRVVAAGNRPASIKALRWALETSTLAG